MRDTSGIRLYSLRYTIYCEASGSYAGFDMRLGLLQLLLLYLLLLLLLLLFM